MIVNVNLFIYETPQKIKCTSCYLQWINNLVLFGGFDSGRCWTSKEALQSWQHVCSTFLKSVFWCLFSVSDSPWRSWWGVWNGIRPPNLAEWSHFQLLIERDRDIIVVKKTGVRFCNNSSYNMIFFIENLHYRLRFKYILIYKRKVMC